MTIAKNATSKLFVAMVAVAMLFTFVAPAKAAMTADEMKAEIDRLLAEVSSLQGGATPAASTAACTFTRPLTIGSQGADVKCLQDAMTPTYFTNAGGSTGYFGPVTQAAVAKWQAANGVSPAAGYFGPISQAKFAAMAPAGDDTAADDDDTTASDDDDDSSSTELTGEASLKTFEVSDGEDADDVEEGSEDIQVAEFQVEFSDGDAMISRLDIILDGDANTVNTENDPWKVFDEISLWVDGEKVADVDASDKDNYLDEDDGSIRFAGLDIVAKEDKEMTIVVGATVGSSVDDAGSATLADWDVYAAEVRFVDADDVTTTETATDDIEDGDNATLSGNKAEFTIDGQGEGDDLELKTSSEDPDAQTISLDEDKNTEEAIFAFDLSAKDSDTDIKLDNMVSVSVNVPVAAGGATLDTLVNDFRLEIDGQSFDAESYVGTGVNATIDFDIDGDVIIDADKTVTAVLYADFEDMADANEGSTISASTTPAQIDAEGDKSGETVTVGGTAKNGETHTLRTEGLDLGQVTDGTGSSDSAQVVSGVATDANYGTMFLEYEVTAFGDDLYVKANQASRGASTTAGVAYTIEDSSTGNATTTGAVSVSYDIDGADESNGFFLLEDGETYKMTVTINSYNPVGAGGTYNLQILTVGFASTEVNATSTQAPDDLADYESDDVAIQS